MNRGENPEAAVASGALQHVDFEDALHQLRPGVVTQVCGCNGRQRRGLGGLGQSVSGKRGWRATAGMGDRIRFAIRRRWHDQGSPFGGRGQYSVVANQMVFRTRDEGGEFFQQILGRQNDVSGSVAPGPFEAIEKASIGQKRMAPTNVIAAAAAINNS